MQDRPCAARNTAAPPRSVSSMSKAGSGASRPCSGLRRGQKAQFGAARRTSPPWYGFQADLAIAGQMGIAAPSTRRVKRPGRNGGASRCRAEDTMSDQAILVTGAAGFIGFHVARRLLAEGRNVVGLDSLNSYYDPALKQARLDILRGEPRFAFRADRSRRSRLDGNACSRNTAFQGWSISRRRPACVIRSIIRMPMPTPISRASSMCWKAAGITAAAIWSMRRRRRSTAPTPSCRFRWTTRPIIRSASTPRPKKANELMAHSYSHLYRLPVTGLAVLYHLRAVGTARHGDFPVHQGDPGRHADQAL